MLKHLVENVIGDNREYNPLKQLYKIIGIFQYIWHRQLLVKFKLHSIMGYSICLKLSEEEFKEKYGTPTNTLFTREILEQSLLTVVMKTEVDADEIFNLNTNILKFNMFVDDSVRQLKNIWRKWIIGLINDDSFLTKKGEIQFSGWEYSNSKYGGRPSAEESLNTFKGSLWRYAAIIPKPDYNNDKVQFSDYVCEVENLIGDYFDIIEDTWSRDMVDDLRDDHICGGDDYVEPSENEQEKETEKKQNKQ